jgi:hypothetical protein
VSKTTITTYLLGRPTQSTIGGDDIDVVIENESIKTVTRSAATLVEETSGNVQDAVDALWLAANAGGGADSIYVGPTEPVDPDIAVWIDTSASLGDVVGYTPNATLNPIHGTQPTSDLVTRNPDNPMITPETNDPRLQATFSPCVIRVDHLPIESDFKYRMYISTDHASEEAAGIELYESDSLWGPWELYGETQFWNEGYQTETAHVIWNERTSLFHMYYKQYADAHSTEGQCTILATSPNGIDTWTVVGPALVIPRTSAPVNHTGYARFWKLGGMWFATSLLAGGGKAQYMLWRSHDGIRWTPDSEPLYNHADLAGEAHTIGRSSGGVPFMWEGRPWVVHGIGDISQSGGFDGGEDDEDEWPDDPGEPIFISPLSFNFRCIVAKPAPLMFPDLESDWESEGVSIAATLVDNGLLHIWYRSGSTTGFTKDHSLGHATADLSSLAWDG